MTRTMTNATLADENTSYQGTGGRSQENQSEGFRAAFLDTDTGAVLPSRFTDGRPAPVHLLDGLPDSVVVQRSAGGRVLEVKASIVSGFVRAGRFYTRHEAVCAMHADPSCL